MLFKYSGNVWLYSIVLYMCEGKVLMDNNLLLLIFFFLFFFTLSN